ncbi:DEAD/DEAH box helicase [Mycoplasmopsis columbinasalis]|uniref:Uncharacterized protein n=1 Tax=Mycoplasmopsis columbinasalis TaxID=114880 RepID=A0A449BAE9_9BACT|nr:hypothetical protein [Mycoplasmopsis columbinasalis]VEU78172.1 Uncharacterised protein [Mycoplasmopsis columbinasalis]
MQSLSKNNSPYDVILFKVGPATGWDIPRACMLVQLRRVFSEPLNIQTIGRIKRNPKPSYDFSYNSIVHKYFIYSNVITSNTTGLISWKIKENIKKKNITIPYGKINLDLLKKEFDVVNYQEKLTTKLDFDSIKDKYITFMNFYMNEENKYLIGEESKFKKDGTGQEVTYIMSKIQNLIDLRIFINNKRRQYNKYFEKLGENFLKNLYAKMKNWLNEKLKSTAKQTEDEKERAEIYLRSFTQDMFEYTIYKKYISDIASLYGKFCKSVNQNTGKNTYVIHFNDIPSEFVQIIESHYNGVSTPGSGKSKNTISLKKQLAELFPYSAHNHTEVYLDSKSEVSFIAEFLANLERKNVVARAVGLWSINQPHRGFGFEYLESSDDFSVKKGFPDTYFVIGENSDCLEHALFIEIKNINDIAPQKTINLLESFNLYVEAFKNGNFFHNNTKIKTMTALIVKMNGSNIESFEGYSTIENFDNEIRNQEIKTLERIVDLILASSKRA